MLGELPEDVVCKVIECLPLADRASMACTSRDMRRVSKTGLVDMNLEIHTAFEASGLIKWLQVIAEGSSNSLQYVRMAIMAYALPSGHIVPYGLCRESFLQTNHGYVFFEPWRTMPGDVMSSLLFSSKCHSAESESAPCPCTTDSQITTLAWSIKLLLALMYGSAEVMRGTTSILLLVKIESLQTPTRHPDWDCQVFAHSESLWNPPWLPVAQVRGSSP